MPSKRAAVEGGLTSRLAASFLFPMLERVVNQASAANLAPADDDPNVIDIPDEMVRDAVDEMHRLMLEPSQAAEMLSWVVDFSRSSFFTPEFDALCPRVLAIDKETASPEPQSPPSSPRPLPPAPRSPDLPPSTPPPSSQPLPDTPPSSPRDELTVARQLLSSAPARPYPWTPPAPEANPVVEPAEGQTDPRWLQYLLVTLSHCVPEGSQLVSFRTTALSGVSRTSLGKKQPSPLTLWVVPEAMDPANYESIFRHMPEVSWRAYSAREPGATGAMTARTRINRLCSLASVSASAVALLPVMTVWAVLAALWTAAKHDPPLDDYAYRQLKAANLLVNMDSNASLSGLRAKLVALGQLMGPRLRGHLVAYMQQPRFTFHTVIGRSPFGVGFVKNAVGGRFTKVPGLDTLFDAVYSLTPEQMAGRRELGFDAVRDVWADWCTPRVKEEPQDEKTNEHKAPDGDEKEEKQQRREPQQPPPYVPRPFSLPYTPQPLSTCIDLFCGAGGASLGLGWAQWRVLRAYDFNAAAVATHREHVPHTDVEVADIRDVTLTEWCRNVGLLWFSPPCPGYSTLCGSESASTQRNRLVFECPRLVRQALPAQFCIENVPGLLTKRNDDGTLVWDDLKAQLEVDGQYEVEARVLWAHFYQVAQERGRAFVVGRRKDAGLGAFQWPEPASTDPITVDEALQNAPPSESVPFSAARKKGVRHVRQGRGRKDILIAADRRELEGALHGRTDIATSIGRRLCGDVSSSTIHNNPNAKHAMQVHPWENRELQRRERMRLQSFPDWFDTRDSSKRGREMQVGNAVPPMMAYHLGRALLNCKPHEQRWDYHHQGEQQTAEVEG